MGHVAFVPWTQATAPEFSTYVNQWNTANTHDGHQWTVVHYGDDRSTIKALGFGSAIRIIGHGGAGDHELDADLHGNGTIKYDTVCDRLIATGLTRTYAGTIDCHSCSSAVPIPGKQAFAAKIANYLRSKGYLLISVVGYFGALDAEYDNTGGKYDHKYVTLFGREVKKKWAQWRF